MPLFLPPPSLQSSRNSQGNNLYFHNCFKDQALLCSKGCVPLALVLIFPLFFGNSWWEVYDLLTTIPSHLQLFHSCNHQGNSRHFSSLGSQAVSCLSMWGYEHIAMSKHLLHVSWIYPQSMLAEKNNPIFLPWRKSWNGKCSASLGSKYSFFQHLLVLCI